MHKPPKKRRKPTPKREKRRENGFLCTWCLPGTPYNERHVPLFYRASLEHRRDIHMCWACHLEGAGSNGRSRRSNKKRPILSVEALEQFWSEDTSNGSPLRAAATYFLVPAKKIEEVRDKIKV